MKSLVIGAGGIAFQHCNALKSLGIEIAGIYDIDQKRAAELAKKYDSVAVNSIEEILPAVDMVHLLTPPSKRVEYVKKAIEAKKPIMIEKPVAVRREDALAIEALAQKSGVPVMVAFTQRFRQAYQTLMDLYQSGQLGEIINIYSFRIGSGPGFSGSLSDSWRTDPNLVCGMSIESLSHDIDFLQSFAGDIVDVGANVKGTVASLPSFDNNSNVTLSFAGGAIGSITASWSSHINFNLRGIIGTKGSAMLQGHDIWDFTELRVKLNEDAEEKVISVNDIFTEGSAYYEENKYFLACIQEEKNPICDAGVGRKVLDVSLAILKGK
ncbi:MAG: Gfo/Idh/MocA family oxidoreductase [Lachnospiraceae bacterium]|nr:Gfo/Idh/MocA family oxidoreductase [Lachnospiraceae bacterium]